MWFGQEDAAYLDIQVKEVRYIGTIIYLSSPICFLMGDQFTGIFSKVIIFVDKILKLNIPM